MLITDALSYQNTCQNKIRRKIQAQIGTFGTMIARVGRRCCESTLAIHTTREIKFSKTHSFRKTGFCDDNRQALGMDLKSSKSGDGRTEQRKKSSIWRKRLKVALDTFQSTLQVLSSSDRSIDYAPVQLDPKGGKIITQYDMRQSNSAGLIKFDFFVIRNLAIWPKQ